MLLCHLERRTVFAEITAVSTDLMTVLFRDIVQPILKLYIKNNKKVIVVVVNLILGL